MGKTASRFYIHLFILITVIKLFTHVIKYSFQVNLDNFRLLVTSERALSCSVELFYASHYPEKQGLALLCRLVGQDRVSSTSSCVFTGTVK